MSGKTKGSKGQEKVSVSRPDLLVLEERAKLVDEYLERLQRLQAEYENYRKRVIKEKEEYRKYLLEGFLYELLGVVDNIQRAVAASSSGGGEKHNFKSLLEGINIVEKQFLDLLKAQGMEPLKAGAGEKFDPHLHDAMSHEPSKDYPVDTIIKVLQPGYRISGRVLRPVLVVVSSGAGPGKE